MQGNAGCKSPGGWFTSWRRSVLCQSKVVSARLLTPSPKPGWEVRLCGGTAGQDSRPPPLQATGRRDTVPVGEPLGSASHVTQGAIAHAASRIDARAVKGRQGKGSQPGRTAAIGVGVGCGGKTECGRGTGGCQIGKLSNGWTTRQSKEENGGKARQCGDDG